MVMGCHCMHLLLFSFSFRGRRSASHRASSFVMICSEQILCLNLHGLTIWLTLPFHIYFRWRLCFSSTFFSIFFLSNIPINPLLFLAHINACVGSSTESKSVDFSCLQSLLFPICFIISRSKKSSITKIVYKEGIKPPDPWNDTLPPMALYHEFHLCFILLSSLYLAREFESVNTSFDLVHSIELLSCFCAVYPWIHW